MEVAAASIGVASFAFQLFEGCVQGFAFFNTAQSIGIDGDLFRAGLEIEKYRFLSWAKRAGISQDGIDEHSNINWTLAIMRLEHLQVFLTSADALKKRYALDVTQATVQDNDRATAIEPPKHGLAWQISKLRPEMYTTTSRIIQSRNGPIKKMHWAAVGKSKATSIIKEIANINSHLELLLDSAEREKQSIENALFLRSLVSLASTTTEVAEIQHLIGDYTLQNSNRNAIKAAAAVKQIRLCIGTDKRDDEVQPTTKETIRTIPALKILKRTVRPFAGRALEHRGLEFATYDKQQVLVQWKVAEDDQWSLCKDQMKALAVLLTSLSDDSFRCLPCLGYHGAETLGRHGLIFSLPKSSGDSEPLKMVTLSDILKKQKHVPFRRRLEISRALAQTVLQLHTAGWLHKNLRSENVIFFGPENASMEAMIYSEPFVMGYEFARPDTEDAAAAFTQVPEIDLLADLYRHPRARGLDRETYQKRFDVHGLGCLIMEVMCWESLMFLHHRLNNPELERNITDAVRQNTMIEIPTVSDLLKVEEATEFLKHQIGEFMVDTILACINMPKAEDDQDASLNVQHSVLERLSWLRL